MSVPFCILLIKYKSLVNQIRMLFSGAGPGEGTMGGAIGDGANSETLSLAYLHQGRNFTEGSADGNKENWAVGWLG